MENSKTQQTSHSVQLVLTEEDVDGAKLQEPLEKHHKNALRWWLVLPRSARTSKKCNQSYFDKQVRESNINLFLCITHITCCSLYRIIEAKEIVHL